MARWDRLSPLDASFLHIEDENNHMHIGSVAILEGPPPSHDEICAMVEGKLPLVPRYRQRARTIPLDLGRPVWTDDPHFNLRYHVRATALPSPGGEVQLRNLVGRLMSQRLDRARPLWEMWMVEGLSDDHWALVSKVHHCMVDGIAGTDLLTVVLDTEPEPEPPAAGAWAPEPDPSSVRLAADAVVDRMSSPYEQLRSVRAMARRPRQVLDQARATVQGLSSLTGLARGTSQTSLNGPIGPHRRWAWARTTLADIKAIRASLGGTVNDVVLAVCTRGFRDLLTARAERTADRVIRTLVPVSVRTPGERGTYNNRVSAIFAELPVAISDPLERLSAIRAQMEELKESNQAVAAEVLTSLQGFAPPMILALGTRVSSRLLGRSEASNLNTVTTNVPGPQFPLYAVGRRMLEVFPYVPLAAPVRVGVAIFSYDGNLTFGVTGDYDTAPDIEVLTEGIEDGIRELQKAVS